MPTYDYRCSTNGRVVEVNHRMSDTLHTWGEVCVAAGLETGETPADTPVERLATGGQIIGRGSLKNPELPPCASGGCGGGSCALQ